MKTGILRLVILLLGLAVALPQFAAAQVPHAIGQVRTATDAVIRRGGMEVPVSIGADVFQNDVLVTGPAGAVGFVLNDDSVITIGPSSVFKLTEFVFEPKDNKVGLLGEIYYGTMEYISGKISKIAKDAAKFRTPYTTVAARGTHLLMRGGR